MKQKRRGFQFAICIPFPTPLSVSQLVLNDDLRHHPHKHHRHIKLGKHQHLFLDTGVGGLEKGWSCCQFQSVLVSKVGTIIIRHRSQR